MALTAHIANLRKYNEGDLETVAIELPAEEWEWQQALDNIGIGSPDRWGGVYEEWIVSEYDGDEDEAKIVLGVLHEGETKERLNRAGEILNDMSSAKDIGGLSLFASDHGLEWDHYSISDVFDLDEDGDMIKELVKERAEDGGIHGVLAFLGDFINWPDGKYVELNAYRNLHVLTDSEADQWLLEAKSEMLLDLLDE